MDFNLGNVYTDKLTQLWGGFVGLRSFVVLVQSADLGGVAEELTGVPVPVAPDGGSRSKINVEWRVMIVSWGLREKWCLFAKETISARVFYPLLFSLCLPTQTYILCFLSSQHNISQRRVVGREQTAVRSPRNFRWKQKTLVENVTDQKFDSKN